MIFNIIKELNTFSGIDDDIGSFTFWTIIPNSLGMIFIPLVSRNKLFNSSFSI